MATAAEEQRAVVLRGDDNVAVAARPIPRGFVLDGRRPGGRGPRADRARAQGRPGRHRRRASRSASTGRSSGSPRRRSPPGRGSTSTTSRPTCSSATTPSPPSGPPCPTAEPRDLPRLPPARRPGRHPELRRRHQHRELLGEHLAVHRRPVPRRRLAEATSPTSTASSRSPTRGAAPIPFEGQDHKTARARAGRVRQPPERRRVRARRARLRGQLRAARRRVARPRRARRASGGTAAQGEQGPAADAEHPGAGGDHARRSRRRSRPSTSSCPRRTRWTRTEQPASKIHLAMECGGSDGNSGVTANPALGVAADLVVAQGGTAVLGETTEIYGAEHLLTRRAVSPRGRREAGRADQVVGVVRRASSAPRSTTTRRRATRTAA